jgi:hypothetical protein
MVDSKSLFLLKSSKYPLMKARADWRHSIQKNPKDPFFDILYGRLKRPLRPMTHCHYGQSALTCRQSKIWKNVKRPCSNWLDCWDKTWYSDRFAYRSGFIKHESQIYRSNIRQTYTEYVQIWGEICRFWDSYFDNLRLVSYTLDSNDACKSCLQFHQPLIHPSIVISDQEAQTSGNILKTFF